MPTMQLQKRDARSRVLSVSEDKMLRAIHFYRYMGALDVANLLFSATSRTWVRGILSDLAGNADYKTNQYLYRFRLPSPTTGNREAIYTLGSRGREYLAKELDLQAAWYFRPAKVKHMGYGQTLHNLTLTRFLVAANLWCKNHPEFRLAETRISYELARLPVTVKVTAGRSAVSIPVIPDAWLLFERETKAAVQRSAILLEIDRGTAYQQKFKEHVAARLEYVASGAYERIFGVPGVIIAYATTGQTAEYRETRRRTMCAWTRETLAACHMEEWASLFRFHSLSLGNIYSPELFEAPVWFKPDAPTPITLLSG